MSKAPAPPRAPIPPLVDGIRVQESAGEIFDATVYRATHPRDGAVYVYHLGDASGAALEGIAEAVDPLVGLEADVVQRYYGRGVFEGRPYLAYEAVDGEGLFTWLERRLEEDFPPDFMESYKLLEQMSHALDSVHAQVAHGAITGDAFRVLDDGRVVLAYAGLARVALAGVGGYGDAFGNDPCLAPEARDDAWSVDASSDYYSVGVIAAALFAGMVPTRDSVLMVSEQAVAEYVSEVGAFLSTCTAPETSMRFGSGAEFRRALTGLLQDVRLAGKSGELDGPRRRRERPRESSTSAMFAGIALPPTEKDDGDERWVYRLGGRDYGPFTERRIKELLETEVIDEYTEVYDTISGEVCPLQDVETFSDYVFDYIPRRAQRRIEAQEHREKVVHEVKRTGRTTVIAAILALVSLAALLHYTRGQVEPLQLQTLIGDFGYAVPPPTPDYQSISADDALLAMLFDFSEPAPEPPPEARRRSDRPSGASAAQDDDYVPLGDDYVVRFDANAPSRKLTSDEINGTVLANIGRVRPCLEAELRSNPRFTGAQVNWSIRPDGRTFNITVTSGGRVSSELSQCLSRAFGRMQFPTFNDVPMSVSFPFHVQ